MGLILRITNIPDATVVGISNESINPIFPIVPSFDKITKPMFYTIINNLNENEKLKTLRNELVNKLISGEIDFSNIDI